MTSNPRLDPPANPRAPLRGDAHGHPNPYPHPSPRPHPHPRLHRDPDRHPDSNPNPNPSAHPHHHPDPHPNASATQNPRPRPTPRFNAFRYAAPPRFYALAGVAVPWLGALAAVLIGAGLAIGLLVAPTDHQQGEAYRIIFVHVPAAWMSMVVFVAMAFWAAVGLAFNARLAFMFANALAPTGALMTFLALWSGALWGKPTWGAWWVWDARLTSELILLFLYVGVLALHAAIDDPRRADRAAALLALVGVVNVPIIYFSVKWWNTLHQGASVSFSKAPSMATPMLLGMLVMALGFWAYCIAVALARVRLVLLERDRHTAWARQAIGDDIAARGAAGRTAMAPAGGGAPAAPPGPAAGAAMGRSGGAAA